MRAAPKNVIFMHMPPLIVYFHLSLVIFACYLYLSILFYTMQENPFYDLFNINIKCTSLSGQRSAKKPTSIACWTAPLFTLKGYNVLAQKKLCKKMLYYMVASRSLAKL